jgi:glycosyltransferase involved in cell wall biosynthesis
MKIAVVHNTYQQPGGEDVVVAAETELLQSRGHTVVRYSRSNDELAGLSRSGQLLTVRDLVYSDRSKQEFRRLLRAERPDVVHVHNTFMRISPSIFDACRDERVPAVQTLHNYRLLCPGWSLSRNGKVCEDCMTHSLWRGVWHGCYRQSMLMTAAVALMLKTHRARGTWNDAVNGYIALTNFARKKFVQGGLSEHNVHVKPNFLVDDPGERLSPGRSVLFVGRLAPEKGVKVLLDAWRKIRTSAPLVIMGDGPERASLEAACNSADMPNVTFAGRRSRPEIFEAMKHAALVVVPSTWYEGFPMTVVEAFACGTPVLCSDIGGLPEIVKDGRSGLHFRSGDSADLAEKLQVLLGDPKQLAAMGRAARFEFETKYTAETNYLQLMRIYETSISSSHLQ